jgi:tRNA threonylcarbamoyladenosine biosynthesis protein TsaB
VSVAETDVLAVLDAKRHEVFAQRFTSDVNTGDVLCVEPGELAAQNSQSQRSTLLVGDGAVRYRAALSGLGRIPPDASPLHRVSAAGHVLSADLSPVPAREVVPLYVREPDAEVRRDLNPWSTG